jgi:hypothetical protein
MTWQNKSYDAVRALKAAQQSLTEVLTLAQKPYLFGSAQFELNQAIRKLAEAQWRLMQAESAYNIEKESTRK